MSVLDAHVHVWDPALLSHPWLDDLPALNRSLLPADIDDAHGRITSWIFVEADAEPVLARAEVDWVAGLDWPGLAGIVGHVEARDDIDRQLDDLAHQPLVVGVRPSLQNASDDHLASDDLVCALRRTGERGLTFDVCVRWAQLELAVGAIAQAPDTAVVIDHLGKPPVADGISGDAGRRWRRSLERLAALPNVSLKCSGLPAEAGDEETFLASAGDFARAGLDAFGAERAMFGGDWPVSGRQGVGVDVAAALDALRREASDAEWEWISGATARAFYGIAAPDALVKTSDH